MLQLNTAVLLIKNNKPVADSILLSRLAADDHSCSLLYRKIRENKTAWINFLLNIKHNWI